MARLARTKDLYDKILEGYRLHPGAHRQAAGVAGVGVDTARTAWSKGWRQPWARPIELVLREAGDAERVARTEAARRAREAEDADRERRTKRIRNAIEREEALLEEASKGIKLAAVTVQNLVPAVSSCLKQLAEATKQGAAPLSVPECRRIVDLFVKTSSRVAMSADVLVKLSRLDRGAATMTFGEAKDPDDLSEAEAVEELEAANEILRQYKARSAALDEDDDDGAGVKVH